MDALLVTVEGLALARLLRDSAWLYPLVNTGHVLGIALLLGAIVPLDLRLLGLWRSQPVLPLWRVLGSTAAAGLVLALACGALLFITRASEYAASPVFVVKLVCVAVGIGNALWVRRCAGEPAAWRGQVPWRVRVGAAVSLTAWLTAAVLGRWIGYT